MINSSSEMMVAASRLVRDGDVVFVSIAQANPACNLARRTHARLAVPPALIVTGNE